MPPRNHCHRGKTKSTTHSECPSAALVIRHAKRTRRTTLSSVYRLVLPRFSTLSHKRYDFRGGKKVTEHKIVLTFTTLSEKFIILIVIQRDIITNVNYQLLLSGFNIPGIFYANFRKILKYETSWKCVQWQPWYSVRTDRHDEVTILYLSFRPAQVCNI